MMQQRPLSYAQAVVWSLGTYFTLITLTVLTDWARPGAATDIINAGAVEALTFVSATWLLLRIHAPGQSACATLALRPTHPVLPVLALGLGMTLQVPAGSLQQLVEHFAPTPPELLAGRAVLLSTDTLPRLLAMFTVTACVAPLVEELFFRGALFGMLCHQRPVAGAAVLSALCFVMVHGMWREWPALLLVAGALTYMRLASGSLLPALGLHVGFNATAAVAMHSGAASVTRPVQVSWGVTLAGWLASAGLVYAVQRVAVRSDQAARARAEDVP